MRVASGRQGSADWLKARAGRITASRMGDLTAIPKRGTGELACRREYRMELVCERLTGRVSDHYVSAEMQWGSGTEEEARAAYETRNGVMVDEVGLVLHPTLDYAGASPDGLVGEDGCIEIKCPKTTTHIDWLLAGVVPEEHVYQCIWVMACCERKWCDFISYDPRLPQALRMFQVRMSLDPDVARLLTDSVHLFNLSIEQMCLTLGFDGLTPVYKPPLPDVAIGDLVVPADIDAMFDAGFVP